MKCLCLSGADPEFLNGGGKQEREHRDQAEREKTDYLQVVILSNCNEQQTFRSTCELILKQVLAKGEI